MSLERLQARVSEIESILQQLAEPEARPISRLLTEPRPSQAYAAPQPFDVALRAAEGRLSLRPTGGLSAEIETLVQKYSALNGLDPGLVRTVIQVESSGNPRCVSHKGAKGLMQLMPEDCVQYGVTDPFDPEQNIAAGTRQLADKLRAFGGNLELALAAYNAGSGAVRRYNGIPPYPETQNYVAKVMGLIGQGNR